MIRNLHWYNANETRSYPLDDGATATTRAGVRLPSNILADLNVRYPEALGRYPFLASVAVTPTLVSITIQCAADPDDTTTFAPVAVFSRRRTEVEPGRHYPLDPQYPGVGGWVVFGSGLDDVAFTGRFAGPADGLLAPRAARAYSPLPVEGIAELYNATTLTGIVRLRAEAPLVIAAEEREINGVLRDVVIVRLEPLVTSTDLVQLENTVNVFEAFTGPCGVRPESGNCGEWQPIEAINAVRPDCDGNITIEFRGCADIAGVVQACGVIVDCALGLGTACLPSTLPGPDGKLSNEYDDLCVEGASESSDGSETAPEPDTDYLVSDASESEVVLGSLPYSEAVNVGSAADWVLVSGGFSAGSTTSTGSRVRSVAVWKGFDHVSTGRRVTVDVQLNNGGSRHNAGVVINRRPTPDFSGRHSYFLAELDHETQQFRLMYFNGSSWVPEPAFTGLVNVQVGRPYRIEVTTEADGPNGVLITATLTALAGPALTATISETTNKFLPDTGLFGIHADRAVSAFSDFTVEEV